MTRSIYYYVQEYILLRAYWWRSRSLVCCEPARYAAVGGNAWGLLLSYQGLWRGTAPCSRWCGTARFEQNHSSFSVVGCKLPPWIGQRQIPTNMFGIQLATVEICPRSWRVWVTPCTLTLLQLMRAPPVARQLLTHLVAFCATGSLLLRAPVPHALL